jgi:hypothetical protein
MRRHRSPYGGIRPRYNEATFIMEARDDQGQLLLGDHPQPPSWMLKCTENQIADYYFRMSGRDEDSVTMETIAKWFRETRSWFWRRRYW